MVKKKRAFFGFVFWGGATLFLITTAVLGVFFYFLNLRAPSQLKAEEKVFVVFPGENLKSIADRLEQAGLIRNMWVFMFLVYQQDLSQKIQAGDFRFSASMEAREVARGLTSGVPLDVWVTIIPGTRAEEVALVVKENLINFNLDWFKNLQEKEGYLMPDSYLIPKNATWEVFWQIIERNYRRKVSEEILTQAQERNLNEEQLIILASLVEREVKTFADQQIVTGILLNRLRDGWPLQIDASVQYALANQRCSTDYPTECIWWPKVTGQDIRAVSSPYNTYQHNSFPPGPISNPSPKTIEAVATASLTSPYWYYISDFSGKLHPAKTLAEHEQNIEQYLR